MRILFYFLKSKPSNGAPVSPSQTACNSFPTILNFTLPFFNSRIMEVSSTLPTVLMFPAADPCLGPHDHTTVAFVESTFSTTTVRFLPTGRLLSFGKEPSQTPEKTLNSGGTSSPGFIMFMLLGNGVHSAIAIVGIKQKSPQQAASKKNNFLFIFLSPLPVFKKVFAYF